MRIRRTKKRSPKSARRNQSGEARIEGKRRDLSQRRLCAWASCIGFLLLCVATGSLGFDRAVPRPAPQTGAPQPKNPPFDTLKPLEASFPNTVALKQKGRLLEFCPDGTCDGFVASAGVSVATLKDFAYLYIYFFSDFVYLLEWRGHSEAKLAAERVLSKSKYLQCKNENSREAARCVLLDLGRDGAIKLIFVRYDEGHRGVVPKDVVKELSEKKAVPTH